MSDSVPLAPIDAILGSMGGPISGRFIKEWLRQQDDEQEVRLDNVVDAVEDFQDTVGQLQKKMASTENTMASFQKQLKGLLKEQKKGQPKTKDSANGRFIKEWLRQHDLTDIDRAVAAALLAAKRPCGAQRFKSLRGLKQAATIAGIDYVL
jgi:hypothetical protein